MEAPRLPPKPDSADLSAARSHLPLPDNVNLLPVKVIKDLITKHTNELEQYVMRFNDCKEIENECIAYKDQLQRLLSAVGEIESRRQERSAELESIRVIEAEYENKWEELNNLISRQYGDAALTARIKSELVANDSLAKNLESASDMDLDSLIERYVELRTEYHTQRSLLQSWIDRPTEKAPE